MTCTATPAPSHVCRDCLTGHITAAAAALDPDRLADRVRRELRAGTPDHVNVGVVLYEVDPERGIDGELGVDPVVREVWEGFTIRTAGEQLQYALVHLAAALAAGARV